MESGVSTALLGALAGEIGWVDVASGVAVGLFFLYGFIRGFMLQLVSLAILVLALVLADRFCTPLGEWIQREVWSRFPSNVSRAVGFVAIALGVLALGTFLGHVFRKGIGRLTIVPFDRLAGGLFGLLKGVLLVMAVLLVLVNLLHDEEEPPTGIRKDMLESRCAGATIWTVDRLDWILPEDLVRPVREYAETLRSGEKSSRSPARLRPRGSRQPDPRRQACAVARDGYRRAGRASGGGRARVGGKWLGRTRGSRENAGEL